MKKKIIAVVAGAVAVVLLVMVVTCPDRQQHHDVLKAAMDEAMAEVVKDQTGNDALGFGLSTIGATLATRLIENVVEATLVTHDYILFSTSEVTVAGKTRTVSIGCFGHVFPTFDADDIKKAVNGEDKE